MSNPYLTPGLVRGALRSLNLRPTRGMGQNFLVDAHALEQIVAAADLHPADLVIEVGPGLGVLTWELVHRVDHVLSVELDRRLAARLRDEFAPTIDPQRAGALHIVQGDVLELPPSDLFAQARARWPDAPPHYKVVANLPYAITSPVLRHFLEQQPPPHTLVVLIQWEVAQRIAATPGSMSLLAHAIQMYAEPEIVARIAASSFVPAPAVDSAVLRLRTRSAPAVAVDDIDAFFRLIKAGFLHARKKLSNALPGGLKALHEPYTAEQVAAALSEAGIAPERRAETLSLDEWQAIYRALR
jgi:16S rRNA (adenine1518-N6/adenine1519-N6)-dimethyltransferase